MPEAKRGADKFGVEHEIRKGRQKLSADEVRREAEDYQDQADY